MKYGELIETLVFLKEHRKLGSEADALVAPFEGTLCPLKLRFDSMSRTFANSYDESFEGGQTVVGQISGENLEFSLLLRPIDSEWAESLEKGEQFEGGVKFLGFDGLYQRGIFGYQGEAEVQEKAEVVDGETDENEVQMEMVVEPTQPDDTAESPWDFIVDEQPSQERKLFRQKAKAPRGGRARSEEVREEEIQDDYLEKAESVPEKVIEGSEEESVTEEIKLRDPHAKEVEEFSPDFEKPSLESKSEESGQVNLQFPATDAKELSPEEIERIMDRGKHGEFTGLPKRSKWSTEVRLPD